MDARREIAKLRALRKRFEAVHREGCAALEAHNWSRFAEATQRERQLFDEQLRVVLESAFRKSSA